MDDVMVARVLEGTAWEIGDGGYTVYFTNYPTISGFGETTLEAICQLLIAYHASFLSVIESSEKR